MPSLKKPGQHGIIFRDVDKDGLPEFIGATGNKSFVVRKIYPKCEDYLLLSSGL